MKKKIKKKDKNALLRSLSYRNQFFDVLCKSMDWFLYDKDFYHERVKSMPDT